MTTLGFPKKTATILAGTVCVSVFIDYLILQQLWHIPHILAIIEAILTVAVIFIVYWSVENNFRITCLAAFFMGMLATLPELLLNVHVTSAMFGISFELALFFLLVAGHSFFFAVTINCSVVIALCYLYWRDNFAKVMWRNQNE